MTGGVQFLDTVQHALEVAEPGLVFVDGNHENFDSLYARPVDADGFVA
jgi:hypothetical protein